MCLAAGAVSPLHGVPLPTGLALPGEEGAAGRRAWGANHHPEADTPSPSLLGMLPPGPDGSSVGWPGDSVSHIDIPRPPLSKAHCTVGPSAWRDEFQRRDGKSLGRDKI